MVCCDMCSGWLHLKCMGMKEGAGLTKEKEFVCHFCVASEEVSGLKDRHMRTRKARIASLEFLDEQKGCLNSSWG